MNFLFESISFRLLPMLKGKKLSTLTTTKEKNATHKKGKSAL